MISLIKPLVWLELIMICNIDLFGDTKVSKAFTVIRIKADGQQN